MEALWFYNWPVFSLVLVHVVLSLHLLFLNWNIVCINFLRLRWYSLLTKRISVRCVLTLVKSSLGSNASNLHVSYMNWLNVLFNFLPSEPPFPILIKLLRRSGLRSWAFTPLYICFLHNLDLVLFLLSYKFLMPPRHLKNIYISSFSTFFTVNGSFWITKLPNLPLFRKEVKNCFYWWNLLYSRYMN